MPNILGKFKNNGVEYEYIGYKLYGQEIEYAD